MTRSSALLLIGASVAAAGGQLLFKVGAQHRTHVLEFLNGWISIGLLLYALGTVLWIYALSKEKLVVVYAFTGLTFALVYLGGVLLLSESLTSRASLGVVFVLGGLYLIGG